MEIPEKDDLCVYCGFDKNRIKELEGKLCKARGFVRDQFCECHDEYGKKLPNKCERCVALEALTTGFSFSELEAIMTAGLEKEVNSLKSRIKELEENLEIAIDERNGLSDSVIDKCNTISRLRESVRYWSKVVDKLRKRAGKEGGWG